MRFSLIPAAFFLLATCAAHASRTTIGFNGLTGSSGDTFTSYTESGFSVQTASGAYYKAISGNGVIGNPLPSITTLAGSVAVTEGGSLFQFDSFDLAAYVTHGIAVSYTISGSLGGVNLFSQAGTGSFSETFATISSLYATTDIDKLTISLANSGAFMNLDNIGVTAVAATPEPSSFALLGTGLLAITGLVRRRLA